jgi:two-component system cell cycle sensor histidine kinase/response regulator CckA
MSTRILIVEDEVVVALNLEARLSQLGYEVLGRTGDGPEAVRMAEALRPDLVLMDIQLNADTDGISAAQDIKDRLNIPVVYLTAYADADTLQRAKITEPFGYVMKPFGSRELHSTLEMALYGFRAQQEVRESREWLFTTLRCIGEAVIATDNQGRIRFMNPAAECLTGFKQEEALDRDVDTVLRLLTDSGEPVTCSPSKRALAAGSPITDDGNYVLLTKSAVRVPIVDGASPIKNPRGEVIGVVIVIRNTTERKRIEDELVRSNEELMQFAYTASHDLQEPLRTVTACTQLLANSLAAKLDPEQKQLMNFISGEGAKLSTLVKALLDLVRVSHESNPLRTFPASDSVEQAIAALRTYIDERNATVIYDSLPVVTADPEQLASVFQNLISNGIKYQSGNSPEVRITAERHQADYVFCVADNGIGIAARYHDEVFRIFSRLHPKQFDGTGIGLATTKRIIERHGGSIWLASEEGRGSRFFFSLPIREKQGESLIMGAHGRAR